MSRAASIVTLLLAAPVTAQPVAVEQVVSRHDPRLDVARARLAGGADGYSTQAVAAGADGTVATAEGHFPHRVAFWAADFAARGAAADFLVNDAVGWNAPSDVAAGADGVFYAADQHRNRVLKVAP